MKESSRRMTVIVGLFVTFAVAILVAGILMIGDLNDTFTRKIAVSTLFANVGGLKVGDNVWYSGVKVGNVKSLAFEGNAMVKVELKLDKKSAPFLPEDAMAKISSDGLIGSRIVVLYGGTPGADPLEDGDVIATGTSVSTDDIMATMQENNENIKVITGKLARGEGSVGKLLSDEKLYTDVTSAVQSLTATSDSARAATDNLATFTNKLNRPGNLPNDIVTDKKTWATVKASVDNVDQTTKKAAEIADGIAVATKDEKTPVGTLLHDNEAAADMKATLENVRKSTVLLNEDLRAVQSNFLLRGYFKKQDKAKTKAERDAAKAEKKRLRDGDAAVE